MPRAPISEPAEAKKAKRGKYAKLQDIQYLAAVIRDQELDLQSPSSRPTFWFNGKVYHYSEVARRIRRAKKSGRLPTQESRNSLAQPECLQVVPPSVYEAQWTIPIRSADYAADDWHEFSYPAPSEDYSFLFDPMENVSRACHHQLVSLDNGVRIRIPPPCPDELLVPTRFCASIIRYFQGANENGLFVINGAGELVNRTSTGGYANISNFHKCAVMAIDLLERGYANQGFVLVSQALVLVEQILKDQDPKLLDVLCDVSILLLSKGMGSLYDILKDKICGMVKIIAAKRGGEHQPWAQIFAYIDQMPRSQVVDNMQRGWICGFDQLESALQEQPWEGLNISCSVDHSLRMGQNAQRLWDVLVDRTARLSVSEPEKMRQRLAYAKVLYLQCDYSKALETLQIILSQCRKARQQDDLRWIAIEIDALEVSARCHFARSKLTLDCDDVSTAEVLLETAVGRSTRTEGIKSPTTIALQHTLWLWLMEQGRADEAALLRKSMDDVVGESLSPDE